jgi:hypothetical protein
MKEKQRSAVETNEKMITGFGLYAFFALGHPTQM